jgi:acyl-CoA oxidase
MAQLLGMATTITTRFSAARIQGRKPEGKGEFQVLDYQNQQNGLFPNMTVSFASFFVGKMMVDIHDEALAVVKSGGASFGMKLAELHAVSSGVKAWVADHVANGIEACRRMCGGHGFSQSSNIALIHDEIVGANTFEGTIDVLVQQHARYLIKVLVAAPFKEGNASDESLTGFLGRVKYLSDPNLRCQAEATSDFRRPAVVREALEVRAARSVVRLAKELQATNNDTNKCMVLMTRASIAHTELMIFNAFVGGVEKVPAGPTRDAMRTLCELFGTWLIVKSLGDFREDNYVSSAQAELVRTQQVALLPVVRKNAVLMTDGWDFTDFELNSAIGRYDGDMYRALVKRAADEPLNKTQVAESYEAYLKPLIQSSL